MILNVIELESESKHYPLDRMERLTNEDYAKRLQAVLVRSLVETGLFHDIPSAQDQEFLLEFMMSNEERLGRGLPLAPVPKKVIVPAKAIVEHVTKKKKDSPAEAKKKKEASAKKKKAADDKKKEEEDKRKEIELEHAIRLRLDAEKRAKPSKPSKYEAEAEAEDGPAFYTLPTPGQPPILSAHDQYLIALKAQQEQQSADQDKAVAAAAAEKEKESKKKPVRKAKGPSGMMDLATTSSGYP